MEFKLYYNCRNGGDGSVSVDFHNSEAEAEKAEENMDEGWGESSVNSVRLKIEDGKLYFRKYNGKFVWVEVK